MSARSYQETPLPEVEKEVKFNYDFLVPEGPMTGETTLKSSPDSFHWEKLLALHPTDVCNRTEAIYHPGYEGFVLPVYNLRYLVLPKAQRILRMDRDDKTVEEEIHPFFSLMVLVYLTDAKEIKPTHTWVSEKDLAGGATFFRGLHRLPVEELEALYGKNPGVFLEAGQRLGGNEILYGDKAFALDVFPRVPLAFVLWKEDEEFSPRVTVLFDSTIQSHLPLDVIWCLASETARRLLVEKQSEVGR